jgi:hypothetical protein
VTGRSNFASVAGFLDTVVSNTEVLESVLMLAPTRLEMGLTPLELLHLGPEDSLQQHIADLVAVRDGTHRYSSIQIVSSVELNFLLDNVCATREGVQPGAEVARIAGLRKLTNHIPVE